MTDLGRYQYGYDQNSNRLWNANVVGTAAVGNLDEGYACDIINRLTQMQRGALSDGVITGTPVREMDYTLDPTGNWNAYLTKTSGTTDLNQGRTQNPVNEITGITASGGTPLWVTPTYDAAGNTITFPQPSTPTSSFTAVYNAWNQMVSISDTSGTVATYQYDGRGRRIVKYTTATSETRHFYWTNTWHDVEERVGSSTSMDKQYVWGIRYVDELVCRDDATPQRLYAMQDANFNVTSICDTGGTVQERYFYDPYGNRTIMNAAWSVISDSAFDWVIAFQGLMQDSESGLLYVRERYLHPLLVWLARDRLGYVDGANLYVVMGGNPINRMDPTGTIYDSVEACSQDCEKTIFQSNRCGNGLALRQCKLCCFTAYDDPNSPCIKRARELCPPAPPPNALLLKPPPRRNSAAGKAICIAGTIALAGGGNPGSDAAALALIIVAVGIGIYALSSRDRGVNDETCSFEDCAAGTPCGYPGSERACQTRTRLDGVPICGCYPT